MIFRKVSLIIFILVSFSVSESVFGDDGTTQYQAAMELREEILRDIGIAHGDGYSGYSYRYRHDDRFKDIIQLLQEAANLGHPHAQTLTGRSYYQPKKWTGRKRDYRKAFEWLKKADESGDIRGAYYLANVYFNGIEKNALGDADVKSLPPNKALAVQLYKKVINAIQDGKVRKLNSHRPSYESLIYLHNHSTLQLAEAYFKGEGVPKDRKTSLELYEYLVKNKNSYPPRFTLIEANGEKAIKRIAEIYCDGVGGVELNVYKCGQYFKRYIATIYPHYREEARKEASIALGNAGSAIIDEKNKKQQAEDKKREVEIVSDPDNFLIQ